MGVHNTGKIYGTCQQTQNDWQIQSQAGVFLCEIKWPALPRGFTRGTLLPLCGVLWSSSVVLNPVQCICWYFCSTYPRKDNQRKAGISKCKRFNIDWEEGGESVDAIQSGIIQKSSMNLTGSAILELIKADTECSFENIYFVLCIWPRTTNSCCFSPLLLWYLFCLGQMGWPLAGLHSLKTQREVGIPFMSV